MSVALTIDVRDVDFAELKVDLEQVDYELRALIEVGWLVLRAAVEQGKADDSLLREDEDETDDG